MLYWLLKWIFIGPLLKAIFRPEAYGAEHVPDEGPAILACNHLSYTDWLFMPLVIPRRVTFVAKAEYFEGRGLKGWVQRSFFGGTGQVPIDRSGGRASEGALRTGLRILDKGELFGIFPEGTRSHDGRLYRGRTGIARLALEAEVPVIPIGVLRTDEVAPPGKIFGKRVRPVIRFGKPLDFSRYEGMESDRYILRAITDEIMYEIMRLSEQEYVDVYATRAKEDAKRAEKEPEPIDEAG
ncbi:MAG TPA: lysophospholipid acyltransferase family protein [Nocardioidaceae bacterium]|nr:lysophospholipid acyltransferase family protein [Nocardioidaceae bacterium]